MYVKRKLGVGDLMPMVRIVSKIGIADFKKCFSGDALRNLIQKEEGAKLEDQEVSSEKKENTEEMIERIGFDVVLSAADVLLQNIPKCEKELYFFLASMCEVPVEDFLKFPPGAFVEILEEIFTAEEAKDFFSHVSRLLNLGKSASGTSSTGDTNIQTA